MLDTRKICVVGGDLRAVFLAAALIEKGHFVTCFALDKDERAQSDYPTLETALMRCDTVVLPMPLTKDGRNIFAPLSDTQLPLDGSLEKLLAGKLVFVGGALKLRERIDCSGFKIIDYLECEELAVGNAVLTAEGALACAINASPITLCNTRCLVAGFGRIGKALAQRLNALGADVTVSARRESDLAWIKACGYPAAKTAELSSCGRFEFVFNTVPAMIFDERTLAAVCSRESTVIDLASEPGGVDRSAANRLGINAFTAPALPGRTSPKTAGELIAETISNKLDT